ncbi:MAG: hypothetical protein AB7O38_05820 [Pirellulaceae bacterium]
MCFKWFSLGALAVGLWLVQISSGMAQQPGRSPSSGTGGSAAVSRPSGFRAGGPIFHETGVYTINYSQGFRAGPPFEHTGPYTVNYKRQAPWFPKRALQIHLNRMRYEAALRHR